jgi:hypothetical protein
MKSATQEIKLELLENNLHYKCSNYDKGNETHKGTKQTQPLQKNIAFGYLLHLLIQCYQGLLMYFIGDTTPNDPHTLLKYEARF